ncbi:MAG: hypothetical protein QXU18_11275 [Thermoplasmatales archaeon]
MDKADFVFLIREIWGNAAWIKGSTIDPRFELRAERIMKICDDITEELTGEVLEK